MSSIEIKPPFLIFVGAEKNPKYAKTAIGIVEWRRQSSAGQYRLDHDAVDLGLPDMSIEEAVEAGINTLIVGTAAIGGGFEADWIDLFRSSLDVGMDLVAGLHIRLADIPELASAAAASGAKIIDVRVPPEGLPVGTGDRRRGRRILTVGTDCAVGKKYTALCLEREMKHRGTMVDFRATGQTGIMIAGNGLPFDSVTADFLVGAAETISPQADPAHWDVIEGQGAIGHPGFGPVSHALLVGSQPDAIVLCHEANRTHFAGWPAFQISRIENIIEQNLEIGRLTNPDIRCIGISVNTSQLKPPYREEYLEELSNKYDIACFDPMIDGVAKVVDVAEKIQPKFDEEKKHVRNR